MTAPRKAYGSNRPYDGRNSHVVIYPGTAFGDLMSGVSFNINNLTNYMLGLGALGLVLTPGMSGKVRVRVTLFYPGPGQTSGGVFVVRYGTGTAPAQKVTTSPGSASVAHISPSSDTTQVTIVPIDIMVDGLTVGTTYWFDVELQNGGGTGTTISLSCTIAEAEEMEY